MKKQNVLYIAFLIVLASCERDVNVDIPYEGDKLVLNSFMKADSLFYAQISKTKRLSRSFNNTSPAGTAVQLFKNGIFAENLVQKDINNVSYFVSTSKAVIGNTYTLKASATGLTNVEGTDIIPAKPITVPVSFLLSSSSSTSNYNSKVKIKLNDPVGTKNYYMLKIFQVDTNLSAIGPRYNIYRSQGQFFEADIVGANTGIGAIFGDVGTNQAVFTDDQFNGKEITINMDVDSYTQTNVSYLAISLTGLSSEAYKYLKSSETQFNVQGDPFAEVAIVYNNIKNGYGVVGGIAETLMIVRR
jgi:Domain of unknown function (DUF4249)